MKLFNQLNLGLVVFCYFICIASSAFAFTFNIPTPKELCILYPLQLSSLALAICLIGGLASNNKEQVKCAFAVAIVSIVTILAIAYF